MDLAWDAATGGVYIADGTANWPRILHLAAGSSNATVRAASSAGRSGMTLTGLTLDAWGDMWYFDTQGFGVVYATDAANTFPWEMFIAMTTPTRGVFDRSNCLWITEQKSGGDLHMWC